ncbi:F-box only protein 5 [Spea bombifrons]|uniref:F-box only protein 5 n=1 Tax=Spea bombifrons TaxID=233779 RepID=UPI00234B0CEF|nr:F-box only protein 5 [Spea bombifrons]
MKCGFKSNQTPTKMTPKKLSMEYAKVEGSPLKYDQEPCKSCEKAQEGHHREDSIKKLSPKRLDFISQDRPLYNKENLSHRFKEADPHDGDTSVLQDSGYSSILQSESPYRDDEDAIALDLLEYETPKQISAQNQPNKPATSARLFPVLHFEEVVCSTLKKSAKRSPKVDWDIVDDVVSKGAFGLENLIGKKMGLERMDILGELFQRDFKHLLAEILRHLSAVDLINVICVSTTWRKILQGDDAYNVYKLAWKECCEKEAKLTEQAATRDASLFRIPLACVQKVASASCCVSSKKKSSKKTKIGSSSYSRHAEFSEIGKTLKNDQGLKACRDCGSPAKYDSYLHRAICTRANCKLDFCTLCLCDYHFSKSCTTIKPQSHRYLSEPLPGSKKSKQNLRRL